MDRRVEDYYDHYRCQFPDMISGQAKVLTDSLWDYDYYIVREWKFDKYGTPSSKDRIRLIIGDMFGQDYAIMEFDLASGEPLKIMGYNIKDDYRIITGMERVELPHSDNCYEVEWRIHTIGVDSDEEITYVLYNYEDYESPYGFSMVYGRV